MKGPSETIVKLREEDGKFLCVSKRETLSVRRLLLAPVAVAKAAL